MKTKPIQHRLHQLLRSLLFLSISMGTSSARAEDYRRVAHEVGDFSKMFKKGTQRVVKLTNTGVAVAGLAVGGSMPVIIPSLVVFNVALTPTGIGLITSGVTATTLSGIKLFKFYRSQPYYRMARIMEYVKGSSKRKKDKEEFYQFYLKIDPTKKRDPKQIKALLLQASRRGLLDGHPVALDVRGMIEDGTIALALKRPFTNDLAIVHEVHRKIYEKRGLEGKTLPPVEANLRWVDRKLSEILSMEGLKNYELGMKNPHNLFIKLLDAEDLATVGSADLEEIAEETTGRSAIPAEACPDQRTLAHSVLSQDLGELMKIRNLVQNDTLYPHLRY